MDRDRAARVAPGPAGPGALRGRLDFKDCSGRAGRKFILGGGARSYAERMFNHHDHDDSHFPTKRLLLLGALIGAGAYYLSREQNRKALDAKLAELGLKDAAGDVGHSVAQGWEKTREAAHTAGTVIADKAAEVKDAAAGGTQAAVDKAKEVAGDVKQAVTGAAETARDAASKAADTVKDKAQDVGGKARDAAQDLKADAKDAADKAGNQGAQTLQDIKWGAKDAAKDAKDAAGKAADDVKSAAQKAADGAKDAAQNAADSAKKAADDQKKDGGQKA